MVVGKILKEKMLITNNITIEFMERTLTKLKERKNKQEYQNKICIKRIEQEGMKVRELVN